MKKNLMGMIGPMILMTMPMAHASEERVNYAMIKAKYKRLEKGNVRLTKSTLFLTKDIDPTKSGYAFDVLDSQNATLQPDEIRLNINDEFQVTHLGLFLYGRWSAKDSQGAKIGEGLQLQTYVPIELDAAGIQLKMLYAGQMKILVNNIVFVDKWDLRKHEKVQRTQFSSQLAGTTQATIPNFDGSADAMIPMQPMVTLSGAKKNEINIALTEAISSFAPTYVDQKGNTVTATITRVALRMFGLNAQNAATFQGVKARK